MTAHIIRKSIATQLREHCAVDGIAIQIDADSRDQLRYVIEGESLTPGQAADKYLPGGFSGSYGRA